MDNNTIELKRKPLQTHVKLGFTHLETAEILGNLNTLLANYQVHYQKLRNFHWNIEGADFFELHEKFEEQYKEVATNIDDVAERVRVFGKRPYSTFIEFLDHSQLSEVTVPMTSYEMVTEILADFNMLLECMLSVNEAANKIGDAGTVDMINSFINKMEKRHWMYTAWLKQPKPDLSLQ